jgi:hypothetical protein
VHTTFSVDAFARALPFLQGEGVHPPADACDFARFCSGLDFFALTDHAEGLTPAHWSESKDSIRQCNAVAGDPSSPDLVAFVGWEWTQVGLTPETHYGHKNVIFRSTAEVSLPSRPISAGGTVGKAMRDNRDPRVYAIPLLDPGGRQAYLDFAESQSELMAVPACPEGLAERDMPVACHETAITPRDLFAKLRDWGFESMVIPHGTTWGLYTPAGTTWEKQLTPDQSDPGLQYLFEIYSGHGNSEEVRSWEAVTPEGTCPEPTSQYEPCCWRAGEIIRQRCKESPDVCERRVLDARSKYLASGYAGHLSVPGATVADWKDCGQCRDCFLPAFNYRPGGSAQSVLALAKQPFGFLASSDNHTARPGTGYKEYARRSMTETAGPRDEVWAARLASPLPSKGPARAIDPKDPGVTPLQAFDFERQASFFLTGGLVAVHSEGKTRDAIWDALNRREVYGTSGPRILLWFDLVSPASVPMGSVVTVTSTPRFAVRALGSRVELPGCPSLGQDGPSAERIERLCRGECHHPGDTRRRITRIEVVRVRPQRSRDEAIAGLVADPWKVLLCPEGEGSCRVEFDDPEFQPSARDAIYYVRAIEEPSLAVNAAGVRCERDVAGSCTRVNPCYGDTRTPAADNCLAATEERAWSSPIYAQVR